MYRRREWLIGALLIVLLLSSCGGSSGQRLAFTTIEQDDTFRSSKRMTDGMDIYVIASQADVAQLAQTITDADLFGNTREKQVFEQLQALDYATTFVIVVFREILTGNRSAITVQQVLRQDARVTVRAKLTDPWPGSGRAPMTAEPYHMIAVEKQGEWGMPVGFELVIGGKVVATTIHTIP